MKRIDFSILASILSLALVGCEGEPPKMPMPPAGAAAPTTVEEPAAEATAATASPTAPAALPPCACNCGCGAQAASVADGGSVAVGDGGAPAAVAVVAPAAATALASISGNVTTLPKSAAASAVVYLEDAPVAPGAKMSASITNKMMTFTPFVSVIPVGGKAIFRNVDPFPHNVFSADNERFNMGMIAQGAAVARVFKNAGAYTLLCNLHPGMLGYLVVAPSSYYAKADAQGHYSIKDVPPGTYKVTAWAPRQQPVTQSVTVKDGDAPLNFEIHR